jgi:hypothetical protein
VGLLFAAAVLAGCGGPGADVVSPSSRTAAPVVETPSPLPSALTGRWRISGAGIEAGTLVNVYPGSMSIFLDCGSLHVSWDARPGGDLLGEVNGGNGNCFAGGDEFEPSWVASAAAFSLDGPRRRILDDSRRVLAILSPTPRRPKVPPGTAESVTDPPRISREERAAMDAQPPPLPAGVRPATRDDLIGGMWMLLDRQGIFAPTLHFRADRTYHLSDGCNGGAGRWVILDGAVLYTRGGMTLEGCDNLNLLDDTVRSAGMDGEQLVLVDQQGRELHRLVRVPDPVASPSAAG